MTYTTTYGNVFKEPYYYNEDKAKQKDLLLHKTIESWTTTNVQQCLQAVKDFLDVPLGEMTTEMVEADFGPNLDETKINKIKDYYNGRLALWQTIQKDFEKEHSIGEVLTYDIPEKYNTFSFVDDNFKQISASIVIEIS